MKGASPRPPAPEDPRDPGAPGRHDPGTPARAGGDGARAEETGAREAADGRGVRRWLPLAAKLAILAAVLLLAFRLAGDLDWQRVGRRLVSAHPGWVAVAVALLVVRMAIWAERWRLVVERAEGTVPRGVAFRTLTAAMLLNLVSPAARVVGLWMRARVMGRAGGVPFGRSLGAVLFDQLTHHLVMGGAAVGSLVVVSFLLGHAVLGGAVGAALGVATVVLLLYRRRGGPGLEVLAASLAERAERAAARGARRGRWLAGGGTAVGVVRRLLRDRGLVLRGLAFAGLFLAANVLAQEALFAALGTPAGLLRSLAAVTLGTTAGVLLGTPGGLGATEAAMVACYAALGVDRIDATAGVLLFRGLHYAAVLALGVPALVSLGGRRAGMPETTGGGEDPAAGETVDRSS